MQATVELLVALLDGVCVFEYTGTLTSHQKFVNALDDLGNVLSLLINKSLHLNHSKKIDHRNIIIWNILMDRNTNCTEILCSESRYTRSNISDIARSVAAINSENY